MTKDYFDKTILIVDDAPVNVDILNELLCNYKRKVAINGEKALQLAATGSPPDLVLLDIEMPGLDGFEVCRRLKSNPATKDIPVIFLTAQNDKAITVQGFKVGASDYLTKPFDPDELMMRVITQLELKTNREGMESLVCQLEASAILLKHSADETLRQKNILEVERKKADELLLNVLPEFAAKEIKEKGFVTPRNFPIATVIFADLVNFSGLTRGLSPSEIINELSYIFVGFDMILEKNNLEKIKTLGDGYLAAAGIPIQNATNPTDAVRTGLDMVHFVKRIREENIKNGKPAWDVRVGVHTGELIAGVIGKSKFTYDIWGVTVNTASRMESAGEPGRVNISGITYQLVKDKFNCLHRGTIDVKNMGKMEMYYAEGLK